MNTSPRGPSSAIAACYVACLGANFASAQPCEYAWAPVMMPARESHVAVTDTQRHVLVVMGGRDAYSAFQTWEWDGSHWVGPGPTIAPESRTDHAAAFDSTRGVTVLFGGRSQSDRELSDTWEWNGQVWTQRQVSGPGIRSRHGMAFDASRRVTVMFGGSQGLPDLDSVWEFDGNTWTPHEAIGPLPRSGTCMVYDPLRSEVLIFGGRFNDNQNSAYLQDTWSWNGVRWVQRAAGGPAARMGHAMAFDPTAGTVVMHGGYDGVARVGDTYIWDGTHWNAQPAGGPEARRSHAMAQHPQTGRPILCGGTAERYGSLVSAQIGDLWQWDASSWSLVETLGPAAQYGNAMAYDAARQVLVSFGGRENGVESSKTWEWDGVAWAVRATTGPSARIGHAMTYDAARERVVLFGGWSNNAALNDTWEWDGVVWTQLSPALSPSIRTDHAMAFHVGMQATVLFGGTTIAGGGSALSDTWTWDGVDWVQRGETGPQGRWSHAMVYAEDRNVVVLHAGQRGASSHLDDLWEWNGAWTARSTTPRPTARSDHGMTYDPVRGVSVALGGNPTSTNVWEWDGVAWSDRGAAPIPGRAGVSLAYWPNQDATLVLGGASNDSRPTLGDFWNISADHPSVTAHPANQVVFPGRAAVFSVAAEGSGTLTYRWRRNGAALIDGGGTSGAITPQLTIANVWTAQIGRYDVVVRDACGRCVSHPARLKFACVGDTDDNGIWDISDLSGLLANFAGPQGPPLENGDFTGDGSVDIQDLATLLAVFGEACE